MNNIQRFQIAYKVIEKWCNTCTKECPAKRNRTEISLRNRSELLITHCGGESYYLNRLLKNSPVCYGKGE